LPKLNKKYEIKPQYQTLRNQMKKSTTHFFKKNCMIFQKSMHDFPVLVNLSTPE